MPVDVDPERLRQCYGVVKELLLRERTPQGHWVGELSTSALSTATAAMALIQVERAHPSSGVPTPRLRALIDGGIQWLVAHQNDDGGWGDTVQSFSNISTTMLCHAVLVVVRRESGVPSPEQGDPAMAIAGLEDAIRNAERSIDRVGGVPALKARYGKDKTFSVPILTHCALAGLVAWNEITPLPFELACVPARFYKTVRLPVVSYALPALIAIGQVRHHFAPTWNPITRILRNLARQRSLAVLERIQPPNGGFLEATPLTSFVTMSLAAMGLADHPVVRKGVEFIVNSVRADGSWPIDTNLATWVTTLAVNALGDDLPDESRLPILNWLLDQQYQSMHPFTNADPGGWAWTDLPGGVPDADDTPGAMLAIRKLTKSLEPRVQNPEQNDVRRASNSPSPAVATAGTNHHGDTETRSDESGEVKTLCAPAPVSERASREAPSHDADSELAARVETALTSGARWLLGLQNRDGGFPTFCRGWGTLPFDRSSPDISAHCLRALAPLQQLFHTLRAFESKYDHSDDFIQAHCIAGDFLPYSTAFERGQRFLAHQQRPDGSWLPLWFGNQHAPDDINPTYGTAKVLAAYRDCGLLDRDQAQRGLAWLRDNQNADGGWGGGTGTPSSVEETALVVEALLDHPPAVEHVALGLGWLMERIEAVQQSRQAREDVAPPPGSPPRNIAEPAPIGFYFAKLWYFERLYPLIFAVSCLRRAIGKFPAGTVSTGADASA